MTRVLIIEDEQHLAQGLRFNLQAEGYDVTIARDGETALELLLSPSPDKNQDKNQFDAIVLDIMLPGKDGFAVASELRLAGKFLPILMLTARGRPEDVLRGFEAGADDYLTKPFELSILIARLHGLLRRQEWFHKSRAREVDELTFDGKSLAFGALELRVGDRTVRLTQMEAEVLQYLIRRAGTVVSRKALLEDVWGLREDTDTRAIDNFVVRLRKYLEDDPSQPRHLLTVRGVGYKFVAEPGKDT